MTFAPSTFSTFHYYLPFVGPRTYLALLSLSFHFEKLRTNGLRTIDVSIFRFHEPLYSSRYTLRSTHYYFPLNDRTTRNAILMIHDLLYISLLLNSGGLTFVLVLYLVFLFAEYNTSTINTCWSVTDVLSIGLAANR
jgi:hypothetical protein